MLRNLKTSQDDELTTNQKLVKAITAATQEPVDQLENYDTEVDPQILKLIAEYFDTSVDSLLSDASTKRKIEHMSETDLNPQEVNLIKAFRKLQKVYKTDIFTIAKRFLDSDSDSDSNES